MRTIYGRDITADRRRAPDQRIGSRWRKYQLSGGYRTNLTGFTTDEAAAPFLAGTPGLASELGMGNAASAVRHKLVAALPAETAAVGDADVAVVSSRRPRAGSSTSTGRHTSQRSPMPCSRDTGYRSSTAVANASPPRCWTRTVWCRRAGVGTSSPHRRAEAVDPAPTAWTRSPTSRCSTTRSRVPDAFDLATYWNESLRSFRERLRSGTAVVRFSPRGLVSYRELTTEPAEVTGEEVDGWMTATIPIESIDDAHHLLWRIGADVEVLEPLELRSLITDATRGLAGLYQLTA